jgi:hypothetical protein
VWSGAKLLSGFFLNRDPNALVFVREAKEKATLHIA